MVIYGKKIGMTHVEEGFMVKPVTIIDISENVVAKIANGKVLVGFGKLKHPTKAQVGQYAELGYAPTIVCESDMQAEGLAVGPLVLPEELPAVVKAHGTSKGKGFAGVMKRHHFSGGKATHGQSDRERAPGSIGAGTTPGRVFKNSRMAGRMGSELTTVRNLKVIKVISDDGKALLVLKGAIPGPNGSLIQLTW
jgi:large subunit ribosomal protein L3